MTPDALLSVEQLKTYFKTEEGLVKAVEGVSFDIRPGEVVGLVGESGSGKTVLGLSILKLIPAPPGYFAGGKIFFGGRDLLGLSEAELEGIRGNRIAMVFQDPMTSLNPYLTIERQLTEVLETHRRMSRSDARKRAVEMMGRVGIAEPDLRIGQYPHQFSGGMRQRAMIAVALLCEPKLLIADEPTTALDVTVQAQILDLIDDLRKDFGTSVLFITHDLGVVSRMADRILVMYAGRIVEGGKTDEILESPVHPYTKGLLASIPRLDGDRAERLISIDGLPPDLSRTPSGCAFHPRCPKAVANCRNEVPSLQLASKEHSAACPEALK